MDIAWNSVSAAIGPNSGNITHSISATDMGTDGGPGAEEAEPVNILSFLAINLFVVRFVVVHNKKRSSSCLPTRETVPARKVLPMSLRTHG